MMKALLHYFQSYLCCEITNRSVHRNQMWMLQYVLLSNFFDFTQLSHFFTLYYILYGSYDMDYLIWEYNMGIFE